MHTFWIKKRKREQAQPSMEGQTSLILVGKTVSLQSPSIKNGYATQLSDIKHF